MKYEEVQKNFTLTDTIDFSEIEVLYNSNDDVKYSSINSLYSRRYLDGIRTVIFGLTKGDKKRIYTIAKKIDFFRLPNELEMVDSIDICPSFFMEITIIVGRKCHKVYDSSGLIKDRSIEKRFNEIVDCITKILNDKNEVKSLPQTDIIYL